MLYTCIEKFSRAAVCLKQFLLTMSDKFNNSYEINNQFSTTLLGHHDNSLLSITCTKGVSDGLGLIDFASHLQGILYFKWESGVSFYIKFKTILLKVLPWIFS